MQQRFLDVKHVIERASNGCRMPGPDFAVLNIDFRLLVCSFNRLIVLTIMRFRSMKKVRICCFLFVRTMFSSRTASQDFSEGTLVYASPFGTCTCGNVKENDGWIPCSQCNKYHHYACAGSALCSAYFVCRWCSSAGHSERHTSPALALSTTPQSSFQFSSVHILLGSETQQHSASHLAPSVWHVKQSSGEHSVATIGDGVIVKPSSIYGAGLGLFANGRTYKIRQQITEYAGSLLSSKLDAATKSTQTHLLRLSTTLHTQLGNDIYIY